MRAMRDIWLSWFTIVLCALLSVVVGSVCVVSLRLVPMLMIDTVVGAGVGCMFALGVSMHKMVPRLSWSMSDAFSADTHASLVPLGYMLFIVGVIAIVISISKSTVSE